MSARIDNVFVQDYKTRALQVLQADGFLLRGTFSPQERISGTKAIWPKLGAGKASKKVRGQRAKPMNPDSAPVEAILQDWEAFDYVYKSDLTRLNIDEKANLAQIGAKAIGRAVDEESVSFLYAAAPVAGPNFVDAGANRFSSGYAATLVQRCQAASFGSWSGDVFCPLPSLLFQQLLLDERVSSSRYVGNDFPLSKMTDSRDWNGVKWFLAPDSWFLTNQNGTTNTVDVVLYRKDGFGLAVNEEMLDPIWVWENDLGAWSMRQEFQGCCATLESGAVIRGRFPTNTTIG